MGTVVGVCVPDGSRSILDNFEKHCCPCGHSFKEKYFSAKLQVIYANQKIILFFSGHVFSSY